MSVTENTDIRWKQSFQSYKKAYSQLAKFFEPKKLNDLEKQGLVQAFEFTYELSWLLIKDFYQEQGETEIQGSKDTFRLAFNRNLIENGQEWLNMVEDRKLSVHTYNEATFKKITKNIKSTYFTLFGKLLATFEVLSSGSQQNLKP
jgi:nucleotidyltransferase substrate binding protein (TIGR01987 family)